MRCPSRWRVYGFDTEGHGTHSRTAVTNSGAGVAAVIGRAFRVIMDLSPISLLLTPGPSSLYLVSSPEQNIASRDVLNFDASSFDFCRIFPRAHGDAAPNLEHSCMPSLSRTTFILEWVRFHSM